MYDIQESAGIRDINRHVESAGIRDINRDICLRWTPPRIMYGSVV